jgi:hypothetical protein
MSAYRSNIPSSRRLAPQSAGLAPAARSRGTACVRFASPLHRVGRAERPSTGFLEARAYGSRVGGYVRNVFGGMSPTAAISVQRK